MKQNSLMYTWIKVDRDATLRRLYLESPIITSDAIGLLKQFCMEHGRALQGVSLMKDLVLKRPVKQESVCLLPSSKCF